MDLHTSSGGIILCFEVELFVSVSNVEIFTTSIFSKNFDLNYAGFSFNFIGIQLHVGKAISQFCFNVRDNVYTHIYLICPFFIFIKVLPKQVYLLKKKMFEWEIEN